jgi:hypothetical protein
VSRTFPYTGIATKEWWANILVWPRELWPRELGQLTDPIIALSIKNTFLSILQNQNFLLLRFGIQDLSLDMLALCQQAMATIHHLESHL